MRWCPSVPHCGRAVRVAGEVHCEPECACGRRFCFACTLEPHSPCTCDMCAAPPPAPRCPALPTGPLSRRCFRTWGPSVSIPSALWSRSRVWWGVDVSPVRAPLAGDASAPCYTLSRVRVGFSAGSEVVQGDGRSLCSGCS